MSATVSKWIILVNQVWRGFCIYSGADY